MLSDVIRLIEKMMYDELRDFIDYCEYHYLSHYCEADDLGSFLNRVRNRRTGLPTGGFPDELQIIARNTKILQMTTPLQHEGLEKLQDCSKEDLITLFGMPQAQRTTSGAIAWAMCRAKAPIRRQSEGNIQVKWIPYQQVVRGADGQAIEDENGQALVETVQAPYLYLRYWQVQGDIDRKTSRVKSIYIGGNANYEDRRKGGYIFRMLARHFHGLLQEHGVTRQRTHHKTGEIQSYKVRPKRSDNPITELEDLMMACVDMTVNPPQINYDQLVDLQTEVTGFNVYETMDDTEDMNDSPTPTQE